MLNDLRRLLEQTKELGRKRVNIIAEGRYPDKRGTKVADVAFYQNDGTDKVSAAKFVEKAEASSDWSAAGAKVAGEYLDNDESALMDLGLEISYDIGVECNRIRTGRLKKSFRPEIKAK